MDKKYLDMISEIEQVADQLTEWESGFVFGSGDFSPLKERQSLSPKQIDILTRIYDERVKGEDRNTNRPVKFGDVEAIPNENNRFIIIYKNRKIGTPLKREEAVLIAGWLDSAIDSLFIDYTDDDEGGEPEPF